MEKEKHSCDCFLCQNKNNPELLESYIKGFVRACDLILEYLEQRHTRTSLKAVYTYVFNHRNGILDTFNYTEEKGKNDDTTQPRWLSV